MSKPQTYAATTTSDTYFNETASESRAVSRSKRGTTMTTGICTTTEATCPNLDIGRLIHAPQRSRDRPRSKGPLHRDCQRPSGILITPVAVADAVKNNDTPKVVVNDSNNLLESDRQILTMVDLESCRRAAGSPGWDCTKIGLTLVAKHLR